MFKSLKRTTGLLPWMIALFGLAACADSDPLDSHDARNVEAIESGDVVEPTADADVLDSDVDAGDSDGSSRSDSDPPVDPYCHYDCFGYLTCTEGVVTRYNHIPVPCEYWTGECPHEVVYTCEKFCSSITENNDYAAARSLCEEGRPKHLGDPCKVESDCEPQVAEVSGDLVINTYLRCDAAIGQCVIDEPPMLSYWLRPCGLSVPFGSDQGLEYGFVRTGECESGLCLMAEQEDCVLQGCTLQCDSDDDCPMGAVCQSGFFDWSDMHDENEEVISGICKPGPYNSVGVGLSCP